MDTMKNAREKRNTIIIGVLIILASLAIAVVYGVFRGITLEFIAAFGSGMGVAVGAMVISSQADGNFFTGTD